jgi:biopolymer transport protein ExbB/TolQ
MQILKDILYHVSSALLVPTLALLVLFLGRTLIHGGEFLRECLDRRRLPRWKMLQAQLPPGRLLEPENARLAPKHIRDFLAFLGSKLDDPAAVEGYLDDAESAMRRSVEATSLLSKIGPMLGLAGTLIPLGPALKGMASGAVGELANNLIVAFTATVVGLAIAGPCYWISSVRRRWYDQDLREMDRLVRAITGEPRKEEPDEFVPVEKMAR